MFFVIVTLIALFLHENCILYQLHSFFLYYILDIRIQQRNGRKTLTTVQGIPKEIDPKRVLKAFKKEFACNGTVIEDENMGEIIQLQGDHRVKVSQFLVEQGLAKKENVKIHGF